MTGSPEWSMSNLAARQINQARKRLRLTREELAERCATLGHAELTYSSLTNIESGRPDSKGRRRRRLTIDELVVLALALQIPPVQLLFPAHEMESVEVLPERSVSAWDAVRWFSGESQLPNAPDYGAGGYSREFVMLGLLRRHDELVRRWNSYDEENMRLSMLGAIRAIRLEMRGHGMILPKLPSYLHILERSCDS